MFAMFAAPCRAVLCAAVALAASGALADSGDLATDRTVGERARPAYDPSGVRAGGFLLFPSVELGIRGDDNIYSTDRDEARDSVGAVRPRVFAASQWSNHALEFDAGADASYFDDANSEDVTDWFASAAARVDFTRDGWFRATAGAREIHEERGDPESPRTAEEPVSREMRNLSLEAFRHINRVGLGIEGAYTEFAYGDSVDAVTGRRLVQDDRDRGETEVSARISFDLASGREAYLRGTRYVRRYERLQGDDLYDRDSDGVEMVTGARIDLGSPLHADLFGGYRKQSYDEDERLPTAEGGTFGGALTWNVTGMTTIRANARRTVDESTLRRASGYVASAFDLSLDHELRRNLLVGVRGGLTANRYQGIARKDDIATAGIQADWLVNRCLHVRFGYRYVRRDSTVDRDDYARGILHLDVRLHL